MANWTKFDPVLLINSNKTKAAIAPISSHGGFRGTQHSGKVGPSTGRLMAKVVPWPTTLCTANPSSMLFDDAIGDGETKAGPPVLLGGKAWVKDLRQVRLRNAAAVVADFDEDAAVLAVHSAWLSSAHLLLASPVRHSGTY